MRKGRSAIEHCGMLVEHAEVFEQVAREVDAVIASRNLNLASEGLIRGGHATKGFFIKPKSCDWGPMAGFVCVNPNFSKTSDLAKQAQEVQNALGKGAKRVHLHISSKRLIELENNGTIKQVSKWPSQYQAKVIFIKARKNATPYRFCAVRERAAEPMWALYDINHLPRDLQPTEKGCAGQKAVEGLGNPSGISESGPQPEGPEAAVTGDYDLFAVWPKFWHQRPLAPAPRALKTPVSHTEKFDARSRYVDAIRHNLKPGQYAARDSAMQQGPQQYREFMGQQMQRLGEDPHMGNVSAYLKQVVMKLNAGINAKCGYTGGNMIHHNDESGNPFTPGQDFPLMFFIPGREPCAVENTPELKQIYLDCERLGYKVEINAGFNLGEKLGVRRTKFQQFQEL